VHLSKKEQLKAIRAIHADVFIHVFPNKKIAKLVKRAKIDFRIGTSHRLFHMLTCNIRPSFTRKNSTLHEAQLNFELLRSIGLNKIPSLNEITNFIQEFSPIEPLPSAFKNIIPSDKKNVIIHPKSQGSAVEWPIEKYIKLAENLTKSNCCVFFSGTEKEGKLFRNKLPKNINIKDISGRMTLPEFIGFINKCDALVACSTGPLHISSILGKKSIGIYTKKRPMHPGRWAPIGMNSKVVTSENVLDLKTISPAKDIKTIKVNAIFSAITLD
jgi:ADP-heptose:LPS heptosyltransferase